MSGFTTAELVETMRDFQERIDRNSARQALRRAIRHHLLSLGAVLFEPAYWWPTCKRVMRAKGDV